MITYDDKPLRSKQDPETIPRNIVGIANIYIYIYIYIYILVSSIVPRRDNLNGHQVGNIIYFYRNFVWKTILPMRIMTILNLGSIAGTWFFW